ncbi:hypothetical protein, partial [Steroidobacter sp.]|uniref:hypothetical protein n=1 Tax=Steroidobacter sp. TaxID=1978227 RepID=UPI0025F2FE3A
MNARRITQRVTPSSCWSSLAHSQQETLAVLGQVRLEEAADDDAPSVRALLARRALSPCFFNR